MNNLSEKRHLSKLSSQIWWVLLSWVFWRGCFRGLDFFCKVKKFSVKCYSMVYCETACKICVKVGVFYCDTRNISHGSLSEILCEVPCENRNLLSLKLCELVCEMAYEKVCEKGNILHMLFTCFSHSSCQGLKLALAHLPMQVSSLSGKWKSQVTRPVSRIFIFRKIKL